MNDQNINPQLKLSLDEELDVLEAVYKIGKEKGLELLRPEQVKKLRDAGRMRIDAKKRVFKKSDEELVETSYRVVSELLLLMDNYIDEKGFGDREQIFKQAYGMSSEEMGFQIFSGLKGAQDAAVA